MLNSYDRIIQILGERWLLHPKNKVQRLTPFTPIPVRAPKETPKVERLTTFDKTPSELRSALGVSPNVSY